MHDPNKICDNARAASTGEAADTANPLTADQLNRWATLIADGRDSFPNELSAEDREYLTAEVRRLLRERLLSLIARAIARDIFRSERKDKEVCDDQTCV
jgi:hypothetical protein